MDTEKEIERGLMFLREQIEEAESNGLEHEAERLLKLHGAIVRLRNANNENKIPSPDPVTHEGVSR